MILPQKEKFDIYSSFLREYNEKVNLTAITDPKEIEEKHFLDSILPLDYIDIPKGSSLIDVGTGAGFPGLPIKIAREDIKLTLLDSLDKRLTFLKELSNKLDLENEFVHTRAEIGGIDLKLREKFDFVTSRAVATLPVLCEYCLPYVKLGGTFFALKGPNMEEELEKSKNAINILGGTLEKVINYNLPSGDKRTLVVIKKIANTPKKYPRQRIKLNEKPLWLWGINDE